MDPKTTSKVNLLKAKLKEIAAEIRSIVEQGRLVAKDPSQLFLFKGMFRELKPYLDSFNDCWTGLQEIYIAETTPPSFPDETEKILQAQVKRHYYEASAIYESHMNPTPVAQIASQPSCSATRDMNDSRTVRARLPQINLPTFSGNHGDWPMFRDTYVSLIHDEVSLSNIERFHFLISCLRGPALSLVKNVPLIEANYEQAWKVLKDNYDDKRRLANTYLKAILSYAPFRNKPTASSLKHFLTTVFESVSAFKQLNIQHADDFILTYLVLRCLDPVTRREFEKEVSAVEFPTFEALTKFVKSEWKSLELTQDEAGGPSPRQGTNAYSKQASRHHDTALLADDDESSSNNQRWSSRSGPRRKETSKLTCPACKGNHTLYNCNTFKGLTPEERWAHLKEWSGCVNCLSSKHNLEHCTSVRRCQTCKQRHHSWLHSTDDEALTSSNRSPTAALSGLSQSGEVILGTALVKMRDSSGNFQVVRVVTDCGSQHSFITKRCVERLGLRFSPTNKMIAGIGQVQLPQAHGTLSCTLRSRFRSEEFITDAIVVTEITGRLPHGKLPQGVHAQFSAYELADPTYWKPQEVEFLLGADLYFDLITGAPITLQDNIPKLVPSKLGYIVSGRCHYTNASGQSASLLAQTYDELPALMDKFWEVESLPTQSLMSEEEKACEEHYKSTHYRLPTGRYVVALPFKPSIRNLTNPKGQVTSRYLNLEHKLKLRPSFKAQYEEFMMEYLRLGHMQPAQSPTKYLIPHHAVTKIESGKEKLRVVFDASCRGLDGSLNDHLLVGPKLQKDICDIIISFRTHAIAVVADIVKMYRQILVRPDDRPFQHILWRPDPGEELRTYELMTVTYGENVSPFLALRTLQQLVEDEGKGFPMAAKVVAGSSYMDDFVTGAATIEEALQLKFELVELLRLGGFELSKWKSNHPEMLFKDTCCTRDANLSFNRDDEDSCKILGLQWISSLDFFTFHVEKPSTPHTKRGILSTIARLFDPLGFLAPVIFKAKTIMQDVWRAKCDWDEKIPTNIAEAWTLFATNLPKVSLVKIDRYLGLAGGVSYDLIGFSDASQRGYAAALYLRASSPEAVKVRLLKAKTKLAPTKLTSIPRLELCGALLLANLLASCKEALRELPIQDTYLFTDSTIVLGWLNLPLNRLKAFVAHRVSTILESSSARCWYYVSSECNPADCASRGLMPQDITDYELWWSGPEWLSTPKNAWPLSSSDGSHQELPETKPTEDAVVLITEETPNIISWMSTCSSYTKILRILCLVRRFIQRLRYANQSSKLIDIKELGEALTVSIRLVQEHSVSVNQSLTSSKQWLSLAPFKDPQGIFRVGGRLENSRLPFSAKHPIILPDCHFTRLLIDYYHHSYLHIGPNALQAALQARYYILSARKVIRSRVRTCIRCQVSAPKPQAPLMGDLPSYRLDEGQIFQHVGVDLGGPFPIKESLRRKAALGKAYLCLFVCMVTKAVHLEVVTSCSTESFLAAFNRFISRRGRPQHMYSDCGTNFVGASAELKKFYDWYKSESTQDQIFLASLKMDIQWHFNPPSSPHFGGIWEAGIKSAKTLLSRNLSNTPLTYEELATLFCRIEAVMNSRPLVPMHSDPSSLECLTPGHFLIGRPLMARPEESLVQENENRLRRWQLVQQRVQHFWNQWRSSYLNQLQQRRKWTTPRPNLKEGDLVIVKESSSPPTRWPIARILSTHPGKDGIVRVATIRTPTGTYKRPAIKLVPLMSPE